jgi:hypothetical protein
MAKNMRAMIVLELVRRGAIAELTPEDLASLSVEELADFKRALAEGGDDGIPAVRGGRMASTVRERVRGLSIGAAVLQACSAQALSAAEIVEAVMQLRPGTNQASIYPEIKRRVDEGHLTRSGAAEPYKYRTAAKMR